MDCSKYIKPEDAKLFIILENEKKNLAHAYFKSYSGKIKMFNIGYIKLLHSTSQRKFNSITRRKKSCTKMPCFELRLDKLQQYCKF